LQIFSRSSATGLKVYRQRLTEELEDSEATEKFARYLNNLFDALNRRFPAEGIKPGSADIDVSTNGNIPLTIPCKFRPLQLLTSGANIKKNSEDYRYLILSVNCD